MTLSILGRTILMLAAEKGLNEVIKILLKYNPTINACDKSGRNVLFYAIDNNFENAELVQLLIDAGINVNCTSIDKLTPLLVAIQRGFVQSAQHLIRAKASLQCANANGGEFDFVVIIVDYLRFRHTVAYCSSK